MADGAAGCKAEDILPDSWVAAHEVQSGGQFTRAAGNVHAQPFAYACSDEIWTGEEIKPSDECAHHVVCAHHLRTAVGAESLEDVVLCAVGETIEEQVDAQEEQAPNNVGLVRLGRLLALLAGVEGEDGDASGHSRHDKVLVEGVALAKDGDVEEHDGQELAALG